MRGRVDIERLKEDIGILEVLSEWGHVQIRDAWASEWKPMNCVFCGDTNGSASVNLGAGLFLCHQCGAPDRDNGKAGDIIDVASFGERVEKREAIQWLKRSFLR